VPVEYFTAFCPCFLALRAAQEDSLLLLFLLSCLSPLFIELQYIILGSGEQMTKRRSLKLEACGLLLVACGLWLDAQVNSI
jgi:hypothetical protein